MQYRLSKNNVSVHKAGNALEKDRHHRFGAFDEESDVGRALGGESWPHFCGKQGGTASRRLVPHWDEAFYFLGGKTKC